MNQDVFDNLLNKYLSNDITDQELDQFLTLIEEYNDEILDQKLHHLSRIQFSKYRYTPRKDEIFKQIVFSEKKDSRPYSKISKKVYYLISGLAAAVLLIFSIFHHNQLPISTSTKLVQHDIIVPNADLKVSYGDSTTFVTLPEKNGHLVLGNISLAVDSLGGLSYTLDNTTSQIVKPLTIETPKGKNAYLKLMDGSEVWLNANSRLMFIPSLHSNTRELFLIGEAFFEVVRDIKRPFIVSTLNSKVEVLGTGFNLSAYREDAQETTTLVHGKVQIRNDSSLTVLLPNMQFIHRVNLDNDVVLKDVDVNEFIAWKSENFEFNKRNIQEVLGLLCRWYDVVGFDVKKDNKDTFTGTFKRSRSLRNVLNQLESVSNYRFEINNGRIVVN